MGLNNTYGYDFYILYHDVKFALPITPPSLKITNDSNTDIINLINMGEVSIPKAPPLTRYSFSARFPMRLYPYSRKNIHPWTWYFSFFRQMKEEKGHFRFVVYRDKSSDIFEGREIDESKTDFDEKNPTLVSGETVRFNKNLDGWETNVLVTLEKMEINEDASEGDDVIVDFEFLQFKDYSLVRYKDTTPPQSDDISVPTYAHYVIQKGDNLSKICGKFGDDPKEFVKRNKEVLDAAVRRANREDGVRDCMGGSLLVAGTEVTVKYGKKLREAIAAGLLESHKRKIINYQIQQGILTTDTAEAIVKGVKDEYGTKTYHVIKKGDTLTGIALAYYGDASKWDWIYNNNGMIENKDSLAALEGKKLRIPRVAPTPPITIPEVSD